MRNGLAAALLIGLLTACGSSVNVGASTTTNTTATSGGATTRGNTAATSAGGGATTTSASDSGGSRKCVVTPAEVEKTVGVKVEPAEPTGTDSDDQSCVFSTASGDGLVIVAVSGDGRDGYNALKTIYSESVDIKGVGDACSYSPASGLLYAVKGSRLLQIQLALSITASQDQAVALAKVAITRV
jgi:hypothetical protein